MARLEIKMPALGQSVAEGTVMDWLKKPGDAIAVDESLVAVSTDKAESEVPSPAAGTLASIEVAAGDTVEVGTVIAVLETEASAVEPAETVAASSSPAADAPQPGGHGGDELANDGSGGFLSPAVRKLARERGLSREQVLGLSGSGRHGRVTHGDLSAWLAQGGSPAPAGGEAFEIVPMRGLREKIAQHMVDAKRSAVHVNTVAEADFSHIVAARRAYGPEFEQRHGFKLSYNAFLLKACAAALQAFPQVNAVLDERGIVQHRSVHLGMAVALEPSGLVVPVLRHAEQLSIRELSVEAQRLGDRARSRKLTVDEMQGGTSTITNPGVFGNLFGTPIIHVPQAAIIDFGAIKKRVVVTDDDAIAIRPMAYVVIAWDHRVMDGATAARFLQRLVSDLEAPIDGIDR
jgi:pyruvate/2-oxoglutarate dehydrogenase complex dihydrolipoamide acyltransferase (E2) component